ncbi:Integrase, catalytic core domain and Ribonuclease H-like domain-containing protein [Strongyloides ratti]|uniref:Integrase, catalytic core domain and Ribonuclease H-like domain-containing protein n=1 Tax=Strongyloides ratti TaxID=34506 RepID=A0A090KYJ0_STRRB|nr:Integrase, catalytic core domain and Ribonuclease H-like domain-containing protein [Strongyloides ratti]CEF60259.1 Integrase, catalytic core domain and Ribonuclease H-like domain-containing protein [Strongyloides ratti]
MKTHERFADPTQKTNQTVEVDVTPYISDDFQERIQRPHPISDRHKVEFKRLLDEDVRLGFLISVSPSYKVIHTNPAFVVKIRVVASKLGGPICNGYCSSLQAKQNGFVLNPLKSMFSVPQCEYLGMIVNVNKGIFIPCFHVDSLLKIPVSTNGKTLKKVLATFNFFAFHMLGYKQAVKALYKFQSVKGDISNIIGLPYSHLKKVIADAITLEPIRSSCNGLDIFLSASSMSFSFILTARYREGRRIFDVEANNDVGQYSCYVASMFKKLPWNKQECMDSYENDGDAKVLLCIVRSSKATKVEWNDVNAIFKDKLTNVELVEGLLFVEQRLFIPGSYCELASQLLHTDHSPFHAINPSEEVVITSWLAVERVYKRSHCVVLHYDKKHKILVLTDVASSYPMTVEIKDESTESIIYEFDFLLSHLNCLIFITMDNQRTFASHAVTEHLERFRIQVLFSVSFVSESNGYAEQMNSVILRNIDKILSFSRTFKNALYRAVTLAQNKVVKDGSTAREIYFKASYKLHEFASKYQHFCTLLMNRECWLKRSSNDHECVKANLVQRLSKHCYRIEFNGTSFVRKCDSIQFLDAGGKVICQEEFHAGLYASKPSKGEDVTNFV